MREDGNRNIVYFLSGPISGNIEANRRKFFNFAEKMRALPHTAVINPVVLPVDLPEKAYMPICLAMLREADVIVMLDGWENSAGANIEREYAIKCGKIVMEESMISRHF